jgi:ParB/RepB/Spo0J family partition protein
MPISLETHLFSIASITISPDRQRSGEIVTTDLEHSISTNGLINPIIVSRDGTLIAGERRLTACKRLGLDQIAVRFFDELSPDEAQIIELEENVRRKDLNWRDEIRAIARIHEIHKTMDSGWNRNKSAAKLGISPEYMSQYLRVHRELDSPKLAGATSLSSAYNILSRADQRKNADILSDVLESVKGTFDKIGQGGGQDKVNDDKSDEDKKFDSNPGPGSTSTSSPPPPKPAPQESLLNLSFFDWTETYSGPTFNFIHCDFPYGVNVFGGTMAGGQTAGDYNDSPDVYFALIEHFCKNLDVFASQSAHVLFWFAMEHYTKTIEMFQELAPDLVIQKYPIVWFKSDNTGIVPDTRRQPRRVYETALIMSRGDRFIVKPVANTYAAPVDKTYHPSTKPEPMLRHFFQLFVDDTTTLFDPTCGGGSALRAAESMHAKRVLGLEQDPEHFKNAQSALRSFRALRGA